MTTETLTAALTPAIAAALEASFAAVPLPGGEEERAKLAAALASGIAAGLVPYLQSEQTVVVDAAGAPIGRVV